MTLKDFLALKNFKPTPWAKTNGIEPVLILRYLKGQRGLSFVTAAKVVQATNGLVGFEDLLPRGNGRKRVIEQPPEEIQ